jgi:hypothetical protein
MSGKRGRPKGTTKDDAKTGGVRFRCDMKEKAEWVRKSRKVGKTLTAWIIDRLNA